MSNIACPRLIDDAAAVRARLARLRGLVSAWFWVEGLGRLLWLAVALAAADLAIDRIFRLDRPQRAILLAAMASAVGWGVYRWLVVPLRAATSDDALALAVEAAHPRLSHGLITALQLSRLNSTHPRGISPLLLSAAIQAGFRDAQEVSFTSALNRQRLRRNLLILASASSLWLVVLASATVATPLQTWLSRNILLSNRNWPQQTYLVIEGLRPDGTVVFPRGEEATQLISVTPDSRIVPATVRLEFRGNGALPPMPLKHRGQRQFAATFSRVSQPFEFRARGGDAVTGWVRAELADLPAVQRLELMVTRPAYTGAPRTDELAPGSGPYAVLPGSSLHVALTANKPLVRVDLVYEGQPLLPATAGGGGERKRAAIELAASATAGGLPCYRAVVSPAALASGQYRLELVDSLGLVNRQAAAFALRKRTDQAPLVQVRPVRIGTLVTPQARVPFAGRVTDDFGLQRLVVQLTAAGESLKQQHASVEISPRHEKLAAADASDAATPATELELDDALELAPLNLAPGASLSIRFEATDNDHINGPNIGRSAEFALHIVTPEELQMDLARREKELRQQLQHLAQLQDELATDSAALRAALPPASDSKAAATGGDGATLLLRSEKQQRLLAERTIAVAQRIAELATEARHNRLTDADRLAARLTGEIAQPLRAIATETMPQAAAALSQAHRQSADADASLAAAARLQAAAANGLDTILRRMLEAEGFQEALRLLYEIEKAQAEVRSETDKARQERIRRLLEPSATQPER